MLDHEKKTESESIYPQGMLISTALQSHLLNLSVNYLYCIQQIHSVGILWAKSRVKQIDFGTYMTRGWEVL